MPSRLRFQSTPDSSADNQVSTFSPIQSHTYSAASRSSKSFTYFSRPQHHAPMTISETYFLAHAARDKLASEAARGDHDLRLLVGHANLLDSLMLHLQLAERQQEARFNHAARLPLAQGPQDTPKHISWADAIPEDDMLELEHDDSDAESDADSDDSDDDMFLDDDATSTDLALTRTPSHQPIDMSLPELTHDSADDSSSDDDASPPSSPLPTLTYSALPPQDPSQHKAARISDALLKAADAAFYLEREQLEQSLIVAP